MRTVGRNVLAMDPPAGGDEAERRRVSGLTARARDGTHAMLATRALSILVTFASITIYARLITPADYGVWAMAGLALGFANIIRELGLTATIVQAPSLTLEQQDAYFWTSVAVSITAAAALALAAPPLAFLYGAPQLAPVLWACSAVVVVTGTGYVHASLLRRRLQYRKLALIEGGAMVCGLATGVTVALLWRNVWALVAGHLAAALWVAAWAWILCGWVPGRPTRAPVDLSFGAQVAWYNVLTYAGNNVGLVAGYRFGAADLGFFNRAQQLYWVAYFSFLTPITDVGYSLLCRLRSGAADARQADAAYRVAYIALARRVAVIFLPYAVVLPIVATDLILVLLGPDWRPAGAILAWMAPAVFGQAFAMLFAKLMASQGRGPELRRWAVVDLLVRSAGAIAGSGFGIVGLAAGFSLATLLTVPLMLWIAGRSGPVRLRHQLQALWPGLLLAGVAVAGALLALGEARLLDLEAGWRRLALVGGGAVLAWTLACAAVRPAREALLGKGAAHA